MLTSKKNVTFHRRVKIRTKKNLKKNRNSRKKQILFRKNRQSNLRRKSWFPQRILQKIMSLKNRRLKIA